MGMGTFISAGAFRPLLRKERGDGLPKAKSECKIRVPDKNVILLMIMSSKRNLADLCSGTSVGL